MKAVIQRVYNAQLSVSDALVSEIGKGLVVYFCVEKGDDEKLCKTFADKLRKLRIFEDGEGKMNLSVTDVGGDIYIGGGESYVMGLIEKAAYSVR